MSTNCQVLAWASCTELCDKLSAVWLLSPWELQSLQGRWIPQICWKGRWNLQVWVLAPFIYFSSRLLILGNLQCNLLICDHTGPKDESNVKHLVKLFYSSEKPQLSTKCIIHLLWLILLNKDSFFWMLLYLSLIMHTILPLSTVKLITLHSQFLLEISRLVSSPFVQNLMNFMSLRHYSSKC